MRKGMEKQRIEGCIISTVHGSLNVKVHMEKKEVQKVSCSVLTIYHSIPILQLRPLFTEGPISWTLTKSQLCILAGAVIERGKVSSD